MNAGDARLHVMEQAAEAEMTPIDWLHVNEPDWSDASTMMARKWAELVDYYSSGNLE